MSRRAWLLSASVFLALLLVAYPPSESQSASDLFWSHVFRVAGLAVNAVGIAFGLRNMLAEFSTPTQETTREA